MKPVAQVVVSLTQDGQLQISAIDCDSSVACHLLSRAAAFAIAQPISFKGGIVEAPASALHMLGQPKRGEG